MIKQQEFIMEGSYNMPMPSAPPSYDESVAAKQPPYNPQMMPQNQVQAGYPVTSPYPMQQTAPATVVYAAPPPQVVIPIQVGPRPANLQCPQCHQRVKTVITEDCQKTAHIAALVLCLIGCYICCCIPYCMDTFKNVHHKCPNCNAFIGTYKA